MPDNDFERSIEYLPNTRTTSVLENYFNVLCYMLSLNKSRFSFLTLDTDSR